MNRLLLIICAVWLISCVEEDSMITTPYIDPKIQPFVELFKTEAHERGLEVEIDNIRVVFKRLDGESGKAYPDERVLYIDSIPPTWSKYPEVLVFHELGHLLLRRDHDDSWMVAENKNQFQKSIMNSSWLPTWKGASYFKRDYYIDELFDQSTPLPYWLNY